jgi:hypothetical protein
MISFEMEVSVQHAHAMNLAAVEQRGFTMVQFDENGKLVYRQEFLKRGEWAKREATARFNDNKRLNDAEFAYSPLTGAVGIRWDESQSFRVFNTQYPMYRRSEEVKDWVSVGKGVAE